REDIGYSGKVMPVNISMIYNLNNGSNPTFGFGFKTNYTQTIKSVYNSGIPESFSTMSMCAVTEVQYSLIITI
uniref:hypothetical protein n=1 Tax=Porcipelethomonas sp. TaxID=2981675 RepID=UPI00307968EF